MPFSPDTFRYISNVCGGGDTIIMYWLLEAKHISSFLPLDCHCAEAKQNWASFSLLERPLRMKATAALSNRVAARSIFLKRRNESQTADEVKVAISFTIWVMKKTEIKTAKATHFDSAYWKLEILDSSSLDSGIHPGSILPPFSPWSPPTSPAHWLRRSGESPEHE